MEAPFPKLADVPSRPQASTTPEERADLRTQLEQRRDEINQAAASLLRGGTEPVPVALESQLPRAPSGVGKPPPPLPKGLPSSPERPALLPAGGESEKAKSKAATSDSRRDGERMIKAPEEADMPPARAAGEKQDGESEDEETPAADEPGQSRGS